MILPKAVRGCSEARSLISLRNDHNQFLAAGGNIQNAKYFHNVISPYFLEIPLEQVIATISIHMHTSNYSYYIHIQQVSPPGLHISLGVFYRLFTLFETECHQLDILFARRSGGVSIEAGPSFDDYAAMAREQQMIAERCEVLQELVHTLEGLVT